MFSILPNVIINTAHRVGEQHDPKLNGRSQAVAIVKITDDRCSVAGGHSADNHRWNTCKGSDRLGKG